MFLKNVQLMLEVGGWRMTGKTLHVSLRNLSNLVI